MNSRPSTVMTYRRLPPSAVSSRIHVGPSARSGRFAGRQMFGADRRLVTISCWRNA
jgi:hypothetical protein